jgi:2-desacetyl-2-hydroxyethyl bacteriochlorophyllide A dehydrogenase
MRALQITTIGRPLEAVDLPDPEPGRDEVVVAVIAAGICHSDVHYRAGHPAPRHLPMVPGHEVAGIIVAAGSGVGPDRVGDRVALHYVVSCGSCIACRRGLEQFCEHYEMLGQTRNGGYAERVVVPGRNAVTIPTPISSAHAAVMMCSSSTSLHALRKGRLAPGESVAVFGLGGLGASAVQLAHALGAARVYGVDLDAERLALASKFGAVPIDGHVDPAADILAQGGADVAIDLVGSTSVLTAAMASVRPTGRVVAVGITRGMLALDPYRALIGSEAELIGSNDHHLGEIHELFDLAVAGKLVLDDVITATVPLDATAVNAAMDRLEQFGPGVRTVIVPAGSGRRLSSPA